MNKSVSRPVSLRGKSYLNLRVISRSVKESPATVERDHLWEVDSLCHKVDQDNEILTYE